MTDIDHMIAVMTAAKEGKAIQRRIRANRDIDGFWNDADRQHWNWTDFDYRVKPAEPRRIWVNLYSSGVLSDRNWCSQSEAEHSALNVGTKQIEFVEVVK